LPVLFTGNVSGTTYAWTNNNPSIGLPASGTGNIASITGQNPGQTPIVATISVQAQYSNAGQLCLGNTETFTITVNPQPQVTPPTNQVVCNGAQVAAINFTGPSTGTTYVWSNNNPSIGLAASGTGNIANFTAINNGNTPITATVTVTAQYVNGTQICTGNAETFTITVNPLITMQAVAPVVACAGDVVPSIQFSGNAQPSVFNWTNSNPSIGIPASGSGPIPTFTAVNSGAAAQVANITVTPSFVNGVNVCAITPVSFSITVNPTPQLVVPAAQVVCSGSLVSALNFNSNTVSTVYTWNNSNASIGLTANGVGSIAPFTALNTSNGPQVATLAITASYTNAGLTCQSLAFTSITINPTPNVVDPANQNLCVGNQSLPVLFTGNVSGTTYAWTNNNPSIGLPASGTGSIASITGQNPGQTPIVATISVQAQYSNAGQLCLGNTETFTITVNPQPQVTAPQNQVVCNGAQVAAIN
jgi:hypothetical protein